MTYQNVIVVGQDVAAKINEMRDREVQQSQTRVGCFDSESLCNFQRSVAAQGFLEARIVKSMYGYSVRYASGLQNFGLIASARSRDVDGTFESAVQAAKRWVAQDPTKRYVSCVKDENDNVI